MKCRIIKTRDGHQRHQAQVIEEFTTMTDARKELLNISINIAHDHSDMTIRNGRAFDLNSQEYLWTNGWDSFSYDVHTWSIERIEE